MICSSQSLMSNARVSNHISAPLEIFCCFVVIMSRDRGGMASFHPFSLRGQGSSADWIVPQDKIRSSRFTWLASLRIWLIFRIVYGSPNRAGTLWWTSFTTHRYLNPMRETEGKAPQTRKWTRLTGSNRMHHRFSLGNSHLVKQPYCLPRKADAKMKLGRLALCGQRRPGHPCSPMRRSLSLLQSVTAAFMPCLCLRRSPTVVARAASSYRTMTIHLAMHLPTVKWLQPLVLV